jgi:hypothetical protein
MIHGRMRVVLPVVVVVVSTLALSACLVKPPAAPAQFADRQADPVVVSAAAVGALAGVPVGDIVAFHYASGAWSQVPMQVDQRKTIELNVAYHQPANTTNPVNVTVYADPNTWVGGGTGNLGALDEISFMAADTGAAAPGGAGLPGGVVAGTGVKLTVTDPRDADVAYLYLFRRSGTLTPGAGREYVNYAFQLTAGDYKTNYRLTAGPNPETSKVTTASYTREFHDRWLDDVLTIKNGNANGPDLVDRHKALFAPGVCVRSEDTFDAGEGAFLANINGPVRAIRSYIGANSGPYTERTHIFYAQREDIVTDLRVHAISSGVMDFFDYSTAAIGMRYANDRNLAGVPIDGTPDTVVSGANAWEKVDGTPGALTHVSRLATNVTPAPTQTNFYEDNDTNPTTQCTGDADAIGSSGQRISSGLPNTDPHVGPASNLRSTRVMFFEAPGRSTADAQRHADQVAAPLTVAVTHYSG